MDESIGRTIIQDGDEKVWVTIERCCESLGASLQGQLAKLKSKECAVVKNFFATGPDGKQYTMSMIDLDSLPMWLTSIDTRKVKPKIREKIVRY